MNDDNDNNNDEIEIEEKSIRRRNLVKRPKTGEILTDEKQKKVKNHGVQNVARDQNAAQWAQ
jgi:hypothetical protein